MSEERREKRAEQRKDSKGNKRIKKVGNVKIVLDPQKVEIIFPNKKITYKANSMTHEYVNYAMAFDDSELNEQYTDVLIGLEMIPSYAHADPELAQKIYAVVVDDFTSKMANQEARDESPEELQKDAQAVIELQVQDALNQ